MFVLEFLSAWHTVSLASACMAERTFIGTHNFIAILITCWIYPTVSSWVWGGGWLQHMGFIDNSGASCVYLVGGVIGLIATIFLKPRLGVFTNYD